MRAIVLDPTREVAECVRRLLVPGGIRVVTAATEPDIDTLLPGSAADEILVANLTGGAPLEAGVVEALRRCPFPGSTLALVDSLDRGPATLLRGLPRTECVVRPANPRDLDSLLRTFIDTCLRPRAEPGLAPGLLPIGHGIVGNSPAMREIFARIEKVAAGDANVCIHGESGTGKELIARAIHYSSPRRDRPLITLDCTAIPEGLIESHLFGHVKGAFTGAIDNRDGVFSLANTGTLFIDELGELSLPLQAKLLRVIQTREFVKVGGTRPIHTNIRLITASNKDLRTAVEAGTFREDLYYRVAVVTIKVPPLRERREDIPLLIEHFVRQFSVVYNKPLPPMAPWAVDALTALSWPGNVRQLENFIEQAVVFADGNGFNEHDLLLREPVAQDAVGAVELEPGLSLREVERRYILRTIQKVQGSRTAAARLLGISLRCLQYKLKAYRRDPATPTAGPPAGTNGSRTAPARMAGTNGAGAAPVRAQEVAGATPSRQQPELPFPRPRK